MKNSSIHSLLTKPTYGIWTAGILAILLPLMSVTVTHAQVFRGSNGHFYEAVASPGISWDAAHAEAQARALCGKGGHLATITSSEENAFVDAVRAAFVAESGGNPQFWIGGFQANKDDEPGGNWFWVNGEGPIPGDNSGPGYANWAPGEPNDCGGTEEHLTLGLFADGSLWNDEGCGPVGGFIVEYDSAPTVVIDGCDSGVPNFVINEDFCTVTDLIHGCREAVQNHGEFVSCVALGTAWLVQQRVLTGAQKGAIQSCAAMSSIGK